MLGAAAGGEGEERQADEEGGRGALSMYMVGAGRRCGCVDAGRGWCGGERCAGRHDGGAPRAGGAVGGRPDFRFVVVWDGREGAAVLGGSGGASGNG